MVVCLAHPLNLLDSSSSFLFPYLTYYLSYPLHLIILTCESNFSTPEPRRPLSVWLPLLPLPEPARLASAVGALCVAAALMVDFYFSESDMKSDIGDHALISSLLREKGEPVGVTKSNHGTVKMWVKKKVDTMDLNFAYSKLTEFLFLFLDRYLFWCTESVITRITITPRLAKTK